MANPSDDDRVLETSGKVTELVDANPWVYLDLAQVWSELVSGESRIAALLNTEQRLYAKLVRDSATRAIPAERLPAIERALLGESQKSIALSLGRSQSTVSAWLRAGFRTFGVDCVSGDAPALLYMIAHAAHRPTRWLDARLSVLERDGVTQRFVSVARPDGILDTLLSPGELEVARLSILGRSHQQISGERKTSPRTVANQLGSIYSKLRVSGRPELIRELLSPRVSSHLPRAALAAGAALVCDNAD